METKIYSIHDTKVVPWERGVRYQGPMNLQVMKENLEEISEILNRHGVIHLLFLGTLIGALREKQFLINDNDADLMCLWPDYPKMVEVIKDAKNAGFFMPTGCPIHDTNFIRNGEKIELWWFGDVGGKLIYQPRFVLPNVKWYYETIDYKFLGEDYFISKDYDGLLKYVYKGDWRVPSNARWCGSDDKVRDNNYS